MCSAPAPAFFMLVVIWPTIVWSFYLHNNQLQLLKWVSGLLASKLLSSMCLCPWVVISKRFRNVKQKTACSSSSSSSFWGFFLFYLLLGFCWCASSLYFPMLWLLHVVSFLSFLLPSCPLDPYIFISSSCFLAFARENRFRCSTAALRSWAAYCVSHRFLSAVGKPKQLPPYFLSDKSISIKHV